MSEIRSRVSLHVGKAGNIPAEIVTFKEFKEGNEHIAVIFKRADLEQDAPLVRIHSECLTGDVFHSSRCDCGDQLDETIERMAENGGIILYMRQEGRGIGLYNKLDAYVLQSEGMNTYQANKALGFGEDLRQYGDAVHMLKALNVSSLQLVTNNPRKIKAVAAEFNLVSDQRTGTFIKKDNLGYLQTKSAHGQHMLCKHDLTDDTAQDQDIATERAAS
ncbi:GTP cyclohydrolase II RibA [Psychrosphaera ytuae]|uniref:GTP cyclohydrolase II n=1 Tax=Psychrosphaera ytuae TaxID=2820710 RepID=A0A975DCM5_9GAMM|nr:GTP cyclohydrolase II RibA [Psychrosphaera ytuae]QTH64504.1 GTP cyclohydrolase II RibA [Psychrosphaera ytuae]